MTDLIAASEMVNTAPEEKNEPKNPKGSGPVEKRWVLIFAISALLMILGVDSLYRYAEKQTEYYTEYLISSGERRQLNLGTQKEFIDAIDSSLNSIESDASRQIEKRVEAEIDASFNLLQDGVDDYLEWYFSARASYYRMYIAIAGDLDEWTANKLQEKLLSESGFKSRAEALTNASSQIYTQFIGDQLREFQRDVDTYLETHGAEVEQKNSTNYVPVLDFRSIAQGPKIEAEFDRFRGSVGAGGVMLAGSGLAVKVSQYGGVKGVVKFAKDFVKRASKQGAKALLRGAGSAAVTSFSGPIAIGVVVVN